jgi:recombination protein RecR
MRCFVFPDRRLCANERDSFDARICLCDPTSQARVAAGASDALRESSSVPVAVAGPEIERLIQLLARLPGLGPRSARRAALHLIKKRDALMAPLAAALQNAMEKIAICRTCGNLDTQNPCTVCSDPSRDASILIVVADVADLWALERARAVNARYHVLGGTLSPLDGVGPEDLSIGALVSRAHAPEVKEIILALNATVDGQTTAHYITGQLAAANVKVTGLAHGVPVGGELDYLDEGTLTAALRSRTPF